MMNIQKYVRAQSLEEAWQLNQSKRNRVIGGMIWLKMSSASINTAIDLCDLNLNTIEESDEAFSIGAMVTLRDIEQHAAFNAYTCGAAAKAVQDIIGVQLRNMATVGGSIFSRFGFSDVLTFFMSLDCDVELYKGGIIPLEQFARMKRDNDILVRLIVKKTPGRFAYQSMRIQKTDFPVLTCAVSEWNGETRAVIGARPSRAMLLRDEKGLLSEGVNEASAKEFAAYVAENTPVGSNLRASAAYRSHLVRVLTERAILNLGGNEHGN